MNRKKTTYYGQIEVFSFLSLLLHLQASRTSNLQTFTEHNEDSLCLIRILWWRESLKTWDQCCFNTISPHWAQYSYLVMCGYEINDVRKPAAVLCSPYQQSVWWWRRCWTCEVSESVRCSSAVCRASGPSSDPFPLAPETASRLYNNWRGKLNFYSGYLRSE